MYRVLISSFFFKSEQANDIMRVFSFIIRFYHNYFRIIKKVIYILEFITCYNVTTNSSVCVCVRKRYGIMQL